MSNAFTPENAGPWRTRGAAARSGRLAHEAGEAYAARTTAAGEVSLRSVEARRMMLHVEDVPANPLTRPDFVRMLDEVRGRRAEFERQRHVSNDAVETLKRAGIYRALTAKRFGGDERTPADFCRMIEAISVVDGSTGWVASFGVSSLYLAALPLETQHAIYAGSPDMVFAGALFPPQVAERTGGGFRVKGRWKFASGCTGAALCGVGISAADGPSAGSGLPRVAVMPRESVTIAPNWDVIGLIGTGSHDLVVDGVVVPEEWTFVRGSTPVLDEPLYRYPSLGLAAQVLAVVGLGVARAALDELAGRAPGQRSITGGGALAEKPYVRLELAKAEAALRSARAFFYEATEDLWATLVAGEAGTLEQKNMVRLAATNAARVSADVARSAFTLAGTGAIYADHPLSRYVRDAMVVAQHAFLNEGTFDGAGRLLLGGDPQPGYP